MSMCEAVAMQNISPSNHNSHVGTKEKMKDITRQGIYRIVYDMVKADYLITEDEIECMEKICQEYEITSEIREAALMMSFAEAINEVKKLTPKQSKQFLDHLSKLTEQDGTCYREEALLLMAIKMCMDPDEKTEMISVGARKIMLDKNQVLFVENGFDEDINGQINEYYIHIMNAMRIGGFEFVYVPKMIEQLTAPGTKLLHSVVTHLTPPRSEEETDAIVASIQGLTTERMYREMLLGKLELDIEISSPSLVMRVGFSEVNGGRMANFIVIRLEDDVTKQVDLLIEDFLALQKSPTLTIRNTSISPNAFIYTGFYKIIFDLITYRRGVRCYLNVYPYNHKNVLSITRKTTKEETEDALDIGPKESAFYVFLIKETIEFGGFNINCNTALDIKYMNAAQKRFEKIYFDLCNRDTAPDITNPDIRRPMLSKIKKAVENHPTLVQKMMFAPEVTKGKVIKVHVEKKHLRFVGEK